MHGQRKSNRPNTYNQSSMKSSCHCQKCLWPVHSKVPVKVACAKCRGIIDCGGVDFVSNRRLRSELINIPLPRHKWPAWASAIARFSKPQDSGVGDTVQRIAAKFGGELFKAFSSSIGMPCGCTDRQKDWNTRYLYETEPSQR